MRTVFTFHYMLLLLPLICGALPVAGQTVLVRAEAKPSAVMVGQTAAYSIRFLNTDSIPNLNTPRVEGLDFGSTPSTSSYQQYINGRLSVETEVSWSFRPTRIGSFQIPGRTVSIRGEEIDIPDVEVKCVPMDEESKSRALLRLEMPGPPYYVGQALPARLALLVRRDLNLANVAFPESDGETFLHSEFNNNPARGTITYQGQSYNALVWDILITPIKAGPSELRFRQDIALQIVTADSRFPSVFSMSRTRTETTTLFTDPITTEILPLPESDRPEGFTGGIGAFEVTSALSSTELTVGEPVTLTITIDGKGNFDRISPPVIPSWEDWRLYPPKVEFSPTDNKGFEGTKSFEFILIPQSEEITEIPGVSYATFNPVTAAYDTTVLAPVGVAVAASDKPAGSAPFIPGMGAQDAEEERIPENILPLRPSPGVVHPKDSVLWQEPAFLIYNLGLGFGLGLVAFWNKRRNRIRTDATLARRHAGGRKIRKALQMAQAAAKRGDAAKFLESSRFIIQECACHLSKSPVEAKTLVTSDCLSILESNNVAESTQTKAANLLNTADAHQFAGITLREEDIRSLHKDLTDLVPQLNRHIRSSSS